MTEPVGTDGYRATGAAAATGAPAATAYSFRQLSEMDRLDEDALRSLFTIEMGGEAFYEALAGCVTHEKAARLLRNNGREEAGHARRLGRGIGVMRGVEFEPTPDMLVTAPVRVPERVDAALFAALIEAEQGGDVAYQRWADNEPDPDVQRLLRLNGREESIHGRRLEAVIGLLAEG
jgi:rubrerythrin